MEYHLTASERTTKTRGDRSLLRKGHKIPAVLYGHGSKNRSLVLDYREFEPLYLSAGTSNLIDLAIAGTKPVKALISEVQKNPVTDRVIHVDLRQIRMDEKIHTQIALQFVGESPAVKELGGNLNINMDKLNVECLPSDLVSSIDVDISILTVLDQTLHIRDLQIPKGLTVLDGKDSSVVSVLTPRAEELEEKPTPETEVIAEQKAAEGAVEGAPAEESNETKKT